MNTPAIANPSTNVTAKGSLGEPDFFPVRISRKDAVAQGTTLFELRDPEGRELPAFTPGSHLTVAVPNGTRRNYSLCGDPADKNFYHIAVKRDAAGRGGSVSMADDVQVGQILSVSAPRNNFALAERAKGFLFVAGGIGITPILSMMRHLKRAEGPPFKLVYLTRDAASTAFLKELNEKFPGQIQIHHDNGDPANAFDLWPMFEKPAHAHIYCCGPKGLMDSVQDMTGHWNPGTVHFESFGVDAKTHADNKPFMVRLQKSEAAFEVGAHETILEALRKQGYRVPSSCESGTCGTCKTRLVAGEPEHRDMVLGEDERAEHIMVCVSRARSPELVLDL